ncbi:MAG: F0F1 ATP synthase subunit gamma [Candidatus Saccharimonadales bacterium]
MRRPPEIAVEENTMRTIVGLTSAFEGLASMRIMQSKSKVAQAKKYYDDLWQIYSQIRVSSMFQFGRSEYEEPLNKELYILITAPGGLMGDIDQRLIRLMKETYDKEKHDIIVIGRHGALQLGQSEIPYKAYYKLPDGDTINVDPLMREVRKYHNATVFYQTYVSLTKQEVKSIDLNTIIKSRSAPIKEGSEVITEGTYIFEPSTYAVVAHFERSMVRMMISELIFDSRLAQFASRFRAMGAAKDRSVEETNNLHIEFNRAKRGIVDQRLKEITAGLKKLKRERAESS